MALNSRPAVDPHPGLEDMKLRTGAPRELVIPPSTFDFSQSTSLCHSKGFFGGSLLPGRLALRKVACVWIVTFPL